MKDKPIRFGGQKIGGRLHFEFSAGALPLDFVNTLDERPLGGLERLTSYDRLLDWCAQAGLGDEVKLASAAKLARADPAGADRALADGVALRETMFEIFKLRLAGSSPTQSEMNRLNRWIGRACNEHRLVLQDNKPKWRDYAELGRLDFMLPGLALSFAELLVEDDLQNRLRLCASPRCDWAFIDRTSRRNRVWCDMSVCGNRAKAHRHYARTRRTLPEPHG